MSQIRGKFEDLAEGVVYLRRGQTAEFSARGGSAFGGNESKKLAKAACSAVGFARAEKRQAP